MNRLPGVLATLVLAGCGGSPTDEEDPRRVLLVSMDTTRADQLGCYGGPASTPALDAFAERAVLFEAAQAPAPTTLASHVSMMTGNYPQTHGVPRNGYTIHESNRMLAERLRDAGFHTAAFLGSFSLNARSGFDRGFDHFDDEFDLLLGGAGGDQDQRRADRVTDAVLAYVDGRPNESTFLFVHYFDPHSPYDPPAPFDAGFEPHDGPRGTLTDIADAVAQHHRAAGLDPLTLDELYVNGLTAELHERHVAEPTALDEELAALYRAELAFLDRHLGRLLQGLEERGWGDEALIVLTADHGETFHEHADVWNHGLWVHDTTVHIPLLVRAPGGLGAGLRIPMHPVSLVDLVPTVLELFELPRTGRIEGRSLVPFLRGETPAVRAVYSEATQPAAAADPQWANRRMAKAIRVGTWKYVWAPYLDDYEALYELDSDPSESVDRIADPNATTQLASLRRAVRGWSSSAQPPPSAMDLAPETIQRLKDLGY